MSAQQMLDDLARRGFHVEVRYGTDCNPPPTPWVAHCFRHYPYQSWDAAGTSMSEVAADVWHLCRASGRWDEGRCCQLNWRGNSRSEEEP